ncbi:hypothetical protein RclHR1_00030071 [Rhizophagus clarus]|uniref:DNA-directed DNA polymerase n=1 Tax=Rhizophagus clarus TaxID=94130 RepID=A0A2Z6RHH4_9GLOM|nr:hypothetical protein RclHR1_00030071 [Rhizophagus clarus]
MPQLMASAHNAITRVLQEELHKKDQIKTALVVHATYAKYTYKGSGDILDQENYKISYHHPYHRSLMREILSEKYIDEHITFSGGEINKKIESYLKEESGKILLRIEMILIESYTLCRSYGGSYIPTSRKLANTKCTINPDNSDIIDPATGKPTDNCLWGAIGCYFAYQDGKADYLGRRIYWTKKEMNPDISINVWKWNEETARPKPVVASKNYNRQHIIYLLALTDITKSVDEKYGQKNHFLWIKNHDVHYKEWCFRLGEAPQRVTIPIKDVNDFKEFKNHGRMINAPCVIIADFKADNKKCTETYGGNMHKLMEQKANSFCYKVHWIDSREIWEINRVLAIKHKRIITDEDKKKFEEADECWICKGKFIVNRDEVKCLENQSAWLTRKLEKTAKDSEDCKSLKTNILKVAKQIDQVETEDEKVWEHYHITVCESVGRSVNAHQISVIAETFEQYKSIKVGQLKYIDSQQFMNTSLANLTKNLGNDKPITRKYFMDLGYTEEQISLVCRKEVYPYEYINSHERFLETELPPIHEFHGVLSAMHDFIEKAKRGGIAMAVHRYFKANNLKMGEAFNPSQPTTWISYVNANNLYGWAMNQFLPIGDYKWVASREYLRKNPAMQKKYLEIILKTKADTP